MSDNTSPANAYRNSAKPSLGMYSNVTVNPYGLGQRKMDDVISTLSPMTSELNGDEYNNQMSANHYERK